MIKPLVLAPKMARAIVRTVTDRFSMLKRDVRKDKQPTERETKNAVENKAE